ncbi:hypothetical protein SAMN05444372_1043 [Flavobacterium micromati]|uniref:Uncharacterized protein n=1 Tax=Flavobacterium micromati TaxID=229205 RepID=A0A1M5IAF5_9FLAO|nr:hypothetical protein SAMN05444372_1043 [Flavobacterium micromati]
MKNNTATYQSSIITQIWVLTAVTFTTMTTTPLG